MQIRCHELMQKFPDLVHEILGDGNVLIQQTSSPDGAQEGSLICVSDPRHLEAALQSKASAVLIPTKMKARLADKEIRPTVLVAPDIGLAQWTIMRFLWSDFPLRHQIDDVHGIHPTAVISKGAQIGQNVRIGPYSVIGENVKIGDNTMIAAHVVIERNAIIGAGSLLQSHSFVGHNCQLGERCELKPHAVIGGDGFGYAHTVKGRHLHLPHQGRVILEAEVDVGSGSTIDRGTFEDTVIGEGTKIDNLCHIGHNCKIGPYSLITAGFLMGGSSEIGSRFVTGGRTAVTGHIKVTDNVQVAGLSGVAGHVEKPGQYGGYPLQPLPQHLKSLALIAHLPEMRKNILKIMKKIGLSDEKQDG